MVVESSSGESWENDCKVETRSATLAGARNSRETRSTRTAGTCFLCEWVSLPNSTTCLAEFIDLPAFPFQRTCQMVFPESERGMRLLGQPERTGPGSNAPGGAWKGRRTEPPECTADPC